ncbi:MAG: hypothetical protein CM1200mP39_15790 [Dehalococcoidia bacterium]|nr:MAG: hypothetical protein CM1200mP39_15790 [Dehalococcoidia bacterium]
MKKNFVLLTNLTSGGFDVIEAGFAGSSPGTSKLFVELLTKKKGPVITSLARPVDSDMMLPGKALEGVEKLVFIHSFHLRMPHLMHQMRKDRNP